MMAGDIPASNSWMHGVGSTSLRSFSCSVAVLITLGGNPSFRAWGRGYCTQAVSTVCRHPLPLPHSLFLPLPRARVTKKGSAVNGPLCASSWPCLCTTLALTMSPASRNKPKGRQPSLASEFPKGEVAKNSCAPVSIAGLLLLKQGSGAPTSGHPGAEADAGTAHMLQPQQPLRGPGPTSNTHHIQLCRICRRHRRHIWCGSV